MRKITEQAINALYNNNSFNKGNTSVCLSENGQVIMYLHKHAICIKYPNNKMFISNAGYSTVTTKERLNGLYGVKIRQKKYKWYLNDKEWGGQWISI